MIVVERGDLDLGYIGGIGIGTGDMVAGLVRSN